MAFLAGLPILQVANLAFTAAVTPASNTNPPSAATADLLPRPSDSSYCVFLRHVL
jgi:hypothetical protein